MIRENSCYILISRKQNCIQMMIYTSTTIVAWLPCCLPDYSVFSPFLCLHEREWLKPKCLNSKDYGLFHITESWEEGSSSGWKCICLLMSAGPRARSAVQPDAHASLPHGGTTAVSVYRRRIQNWQPPEGEEYVSSWCLSAPSSLHFEKF